MKYRLNLLNSGEDNRNQHKPIILPHLQYYRSNHPYVQTSISADDMQTLSIFAAFIHTITGFWSKLMKYETWKIHTDTEPHRQIHQLDINKENR